jgi:hypothetical protein
MLSPVWGHGHFHAVLPDSRHRVFMRGIHMPTRFAGALLAGACAAGPVPTAWIVSGPDDTSCVAAAALSGWVALADSFEDAVEVRWSDASLRATLTRGEMLALAPWMSLDGSPDGPVGLALSDSGRLLFIAIADDTTAPDGQASDAILRYDTDTGALTLFARLELVGGSGAFAHTPMVHFRGALHVGTLGAVRTYRALGNDLAGSLLATSTAGAAQPTTALAIDRAAGTMYGSWGNTLSRTTASTTPMTFTTVGTMPGATIGLAWSDHYGGPGQGGLYALDSTVAPAIFRVWFVPPAQAQGGQALAPQLSYAGLAAWHDLAATSDGAILAGADEDAVLIRDSLDARMPFDTWARDEFVQHVAFARSLVTFGPGMGGGPPGWVIDADVAAGGTRFHPATPDGACWAVLALLMNDEINHDPSAQSEVATILRRYAGRAPDGIVPLRNADGIYWHWIEPTTGNARAGWASEFSTMSTMKIVLAADRARARFPSNADIRASADAIICGIQNWDSYFTPDSRMYLVGTSSGPAPGSQSSGWHEGVLFADEAGAFGSLNATLARSRWLDRSPWPLGAYLAGRPVTSNAFGTFLPTFVTMYPLLTIRAFRDDLAWRTNVDNLRASHGAWTDDHAPRWNTVFSAGTTKSQWAGGGYHADSLSNHPGDLSTFTSLLALSAGNGGSGGRVPEAIGAYNAYRRGARQAFQGGASILYRRSSMDPAYLPNSAGLPDVTIGALGLAEVLSPGSVLRVLTGDYAPCALCPADFNADGTVDFFDYDDFVTCFEGGACPPGGGGGDFNRDGSIDFFDYDDFVIAFNTPC